MAPTVDHLADSDSLLATRDPELTARFINDALPHLSQLSDRARWLTCNGVDAEDLVQETMLKAYAGFNTLSEGTSLRAWLFRIMTNTYINFLLRAHHRPSEYLSDRITGRQLAAQRGQSPDWPRSFEFDALDTLPDIELADASGDTGHAVPADCSRSRYRRTPAPRERRYDGALRGHRHVTTAPRAPTIASPVDHHTGTNISTSATATTPSRCRCRFFLVAAGSALIIVVPRPARARRSTASAMRQLLLRAVLLLASWATGLLVAAWIVPGVSSSVPGFIVAVVVFAVTQAILSLSILKLPHRYASLLLGGAGLALTIIALILASILTHGLSIDGMESWLATTVVVWLVTTIGAITLPELLIRDGAGST